MVIYQLLNELKQEKEIEKRINNYINHNPLKLKIMSKVSVIGAGNVGSTTAMDIARLNIVNDVVLLDIKEGFAEGKAIDISQSGFSLGMKTEVIGVTNDYSKTENSDVIVITSGVARKPGMTREQLVGVNSSIMKDIVTKCHTYSKDAIYIIVSNPIDTLTYYAQLILKSLGKKDVVNKVFGFGNLLDSSRFAYFIQKKLYEVSGKMINLDKIHAWVIGMHSDSGMIPLIEDAYFIDEHDDYVSVSEYFTVDQKREIVESTMKGGATLTSLLGTSAWEAPAACIASTVNAIITRERKFMPVSIYRSEYHCCIGTCTLIGPNGVEEIYPSAEYNVTKKFEDSVNAIKNVNKELPAIN